MAKLKLHHIEYTFEKLLLFEKVCRIVDYLSDSFIVNYYSCSINENSKMDIGMKHKQDKDKTITIKIDRIIFWGFEAAEAYDLFTLIINDLSNGE